MKFCPNGECPHLARFARIGEFLDSVDLCSDCGAPLEEGEAPPAMVTEYRELTTICETSDLVRANILRSVLSAAGIPAHVSGGALQGALGELPVTVFRVQVSLEHAESARELAVADV